MSTKCFTLSLLILFAQAVFTQTPNSVPTPTPTPAPVEEKEIVKITTSLIQIDVTVVDRKGKIVSDLRRDEIEIYENGKKQDISGFSFVDNRREVVVKEKDKGQTTTFVPGSQLKPDEVRRTIALVVDDLSLSFESVYQVRRALKKFVDEQMQEGDLVAVIRTGAGIGALQQFTSDKRQLYAAIENVRWNPAGAGKIGAFSPLVARDEAGQEPEEPSGARTQEEIEGEFNDFRNSIFATGTLGAINYIVRGMGELPGRKSILLLSDGFGIYSSTNRLDSARVLHALRRLVDQANRAAVVVNTMDARGLQFTGLTAADDTRGWSAESLGRVSSDRSKEIEDTQDGLRYLARETGGTAVYNNNDLAGGIRKILDDQSYYLVGYEPDDSTFDPRVRRFHKLIVKVNRPGTTVRFRSGFFGIADEVAKRPIETGNQKLLNALTSPFAMNEIAVRMNGLFNHTPAAGTAVRSLVHIDAKDLTFSELPDGKKEAKFDIAALSFGVNGAIVSEISKTFTMTVDKETYAKAMEFGMVYDLNFPVKKAGAVQLRIAVRDKSTDRVGSATQFVDVSDIKKKRLILSGVMLQGLTFEAYKKMSNGEKVEEVSDPLRDTSLRRFKSGSVVNYGFSIYNAKSDKGRDPDLTYQVRLFYEGKPVFEGKVQPIAIRPIPSLNALGFAGTLSLAEKMTPGEYVLQVTVVDKMAKEKYGTVSQFIQFEVVP